MAGRDTDMCIKGKIPGDTDEAGRGTDMCINGKIPADTDEEIESFLKRMNKPAVKTFVTEGGDVYDCVDFYKQPAFDNPLFRNNIQMKPSSPPSAEKDEAPAIFIHDLASGMKKEVVEFHGRLSNFKCPEGTVPIRRILKSDILRASSLSTFGKKCQCCSPYRPPGFFMERGLENSKDDGGKG